MVRMSEKPVISKTSIMSSQTFLITMVPFVFMTFCAERRTRRPAEEIYSRSLKSKTSSSTPSSDSFSAVSSCGAVVVSRRPTRARVRVFELF